VEMGAGLNGRKMGSNCDLNIYVNGKLSIGEMSYPPIKLRRFCELDNTAVLTWPTIVRMP
jgi:hypothetical protein